MNNTFFITIAALVVAFFLYEMVRNRTKKRSAESVAVIEAFLEEQLPDEKVSDLKWVMIADNELLADHEWLIAYREDWMFWIPVVIAPFGKSLRLNGEEYDRIAHSSITDLTVSPERYQFKIERGFTTKRMRMPKKGFFGEDQSAEVEDFIRYLQQLEKVVAEKSVQ